MELSYVAIQRESGVRRGGGDAGVEGLKRGAGGRHAAVVLWLKQTH